MSSHDPSQSPLCLLNAQGRQGGLPREQMPLKPGLGMHFLPGSHIYGGQLLASGTQTLALETADFCSDEHRCQSSDLEVDGFVAKVADVTIISYHG